VTYKVSSLPTRDWNVVGTGWPGYAIRQFLAYLQGIETKQGSTRYIWTSSVSSLPTRDWNWIALKGLSVAKIVSSLPTRDWNSFDTRRWHERAKGFLAYLQGIETREFQLPSLATNLVSSLPTRDWNSLALYSPPRCRAVSSLPTRDWNCRRYTWRLSTEGHVSSLPTRDWNRTRLRTTRQGVSQVSSLPTRDWNVATLKADLSISYCF